MQYTCSYLFMSHVQSVMAYIWYITFAYNVLSIKIRVNVNTHGYMYIYVMWQNKSEQRMDEHDLGHLVFLIDTETWGSFTSYMGVQWTLHCSTCVHFNEIWKTLPTQWRCEIVLFLFFHVRNVPDSIYRILLIRSHETPFDTRLNASSNLYGSCIFLQLDMI